MRTIIFLPLAAALALSACNAPATSAPEKAEAAAADTSQDGAAPLKAYTDAVNSNNIDTLMALVTDDIVLQDAGHTEVVGKAAARQFGAGYFAAFTSVWEKTARDFIVVGDWAFSRYGYKVTNTSKADGTVITDTGKGLLVYHRTAGGPWLVARDSWNSDTPAAH